LYIVDLEDNIIIAHLFWKFDAIVILILDIFTHGDLFKKENFTLLNVMKYLLFITFIVLKCNYFKTYIYKRILKRGSDEWFGSWLGLRGLKRVVLLLMRV